VNKATLDKKNNLPNKGFLVQTIHINVSAGQTVNGYQALYTHGTKNVTC
jgi:hypothetical protein